MGQISGICERGGEGVQRGWPAGFTTGEQRENRKMRGHDSERGRKELLHRKEVAEIEMENKLHRSVFSAIRKRMWKRYTKRGGKGLGSLKKIWVQELDD